jgi:hypothetical protein
VQHGIEVLCRLGDVQVKLHVVQDPEILSRIFIPFECAQMLRWLTWSICPLDKCAYWTSNIGGSLLYIFGMMTEIEVITTAVDFPAIKKTNWRSGLSRKPSNTVLAWICKGFLSAFTFSTSNLFAYHHQYAADSAVPFTSSLCTSFPLGRDMI